MAANPETRPGLSGDPVDSEEGTSRLASRRWTASDAPKASTPWSSITSSAWSV